ncbi:unknown [[Mannheimia] succiniciproducens MBEL55E]|uniref:Uncharacterized protein n=1 Tax=Mannheimia succiniciproducens (strain KCTC 0769BP / MBEL55E) TaxID=221988 RepID=Q65Q40_MANSM|nr:unknown [[Mannheimia] succiniciproducens MBEL55E]
MNKNKRNISQSIGFSDKFTKTVVYIFLQIFY